MELAFSTFAVNGFYTLCVLATIGFGVFIIRLCDKGPTL
jgi:hypothetical protein